jgi:AcrR family transcriptional regulator
MKAHDRLLDATLALVCRYGARVSLNRIIVEADVALMTVYRQFGGKDALVAAALDRWSRQWIGRMGQAVRRPGLDPRRRMEVFWDGVVAWLADEGFTGSPIADATRELRGDKDHPVHAVAATHRGRWQGLLTELAEAAGAREPERVAWQLELLVEGAVMVASTDRRPTVVADIRSFGQLAVELTIAGPGDERPPFPQREREDRTLAVL